VQDKVIIFLKKITTVIVTYYAGELFK